MSSHPDKVSPERREEAEVQFKIISQAYEILHDEEKRSLYDTHGISAFTTGRPDMFQRSNYADIDEMMEQLFGGNFPGVRTGQSGKNKNAKSRNEERSYEVTLEDLYKGKTTRFASTRIIACSACQGSGGKANARSHKCFGCDGRGKNKKTSITIFLTVSKARGT